MAYPIKHHNQPVKMDRRMDASPKRGRYVGDERHRREFHRIGEETLCGGHSLSDGPKLVQQRVYAERKWKTFFVCHVVHANPTITDSAVRLLLRRDVHLVCQRYWGMWVKYQKELGGIGIHHLSIYMRTASDTLANDALPQPLSRD